MIRAVHNCCSNVDHRVTGAPARLHLLLDALTNRGDILSRNRSAHYLVDEFEPAATLHRLELDHRVAVHTTSAGLPLEQTACAHGLGDGLLVRHLRLAAIGFHLVLAEHAVKNNLKVQLAHARDDHLAGLFIGPHLEGGVFLSEAYQGVVQFVLVNLGLRLDGNRDDRLWELDRLKHDWLGGVAERIARESLFQAHDGGDVTRVHLLCVFAVVGVHLQQATNTLFLTLAAVQHEGARLHLTGVHAEVRESSNVGVGHYLEHQRRERCVLVGRAFHPIFRARLQTLHGRHLQRRRQVINHGVEKQLHALVL